MIFSLINHAILAKLKPIIIYPSNHLIYAIEKTQTIYLYAQFPEKVVFRTTNQNHSNHIRHMPQCAAKILSTVIKWWVYCIVLQIREMQSRNAPKSTKFVSRDWRGESALNYLVSRMVGESRGLICDEAARSLYIYIYIPKTSTSYLKSRIPEPPNSSIIHSKEETIVQWCALPRPPKWPHLNSSLLCFVYSWFICLRLRESHIKSFI